MAHDTHLIGVKKPEDSKCPRDYDRIVSTMPAGKTFRSLSESISRLTKKD